MTETRRRTWWQVLVAAVIVVAMVGIAVIGGAAYLFYRHIRSEAVSSATADSRMADVRAKFGGQEAWLRIASDGSAEITGRPDARGSHARLVSLRVLAYNPDEGRLADVSVPFWLLRLAPEGQLRLDAGSGIDFDAERLKLNVSALEALGPGLVLDHAQADGTRLLVWTE
jgi:hypothetical protein